MPPSVTQARPRRFVLAFFVSAALLLVPAVLLSLYFGPSRWELLRIGHLAERDFGARQAQVPLERLPAPAAGEPTDIIVLGDSFSVTNMWQSELTRLTGQRVATWYFDTVQCTDDWIEKAIAGAVRPGVRTVIVESVERAFLHRFQAKPDCAREAYPPHDMPVTPAGLPRPGWRIFPMDIRHLATLALRYREAREARGRYESGRAVVVDLVRTDLFSHALSSRLPYYIGDELKYSTWSDAKAEALVTRLVAWRERAAAGGINLLFLVIPDKSSVYWPHIDPAQQLPYPQHGERLFTLIAERLGEQYDLLRYMREEAMRYPDLYDPDGAHLSVMGYRVLAERLAQWVKPVTS